MDNQAGRNEDVKKLGEKIADIEFAMLTTIEEDGRLRSRPMSTIRVDFDGNLYFFTRASSPKVDEVEREREVCVSYAKPDDQLYVSVSGKGRIVRDREKMKELWNPILKAWFPEGLDDPEVALLEIHVEQAEYWDGPSSTIVYLAGLAKSLISDEPYKPGDHEKLDLKQSATNQS